MAAVAATMVSGNQLQVTVDFDLPHEFKLNQLAPVGYRLLADESQTVVDSAAIGPKKRAESDGKSASFVIPLTGKSGQVDLEIQLTFQYCSDGKGGVCRFATQRWKLPLTSSADGEKTLMLIAKP